MASVNKVILIGNLTKDIEVKRFPNGDAVANFSIATNEDWVKDGQKQERVEYHNLVVYGKTAENCGKYLAKGSPVYVEGSLRTRSFDDKNGNKRYITEVHVQRVQFLGAPGGGREDSGSHRHEDVDNTFA